MYLSLADVGFVIKDDGGSMYSMSSKSSGPLPEESDAQAQLIDFEAVDRFVESLRSDRVSVVSASALQAPSM